MRKRIVRNVASWQVRGHLKAHHDQCLYLRILCQHGDAGRQPCSRGTPRQCTWHSIPSGEQCVSILSIKSDLSVVRRLVFKGTTGSLAGCTAVDANILYTYICMDQELKYSICQFQRFYFNARIVVGDDVAMSCPATCNLHSFIAIRTAVGRLKPSPPEFSVLGGGGSRSMWSSGWSRLRKSKTWSRR